VARFHLNLCSQGGGSTGLGGNKGCQSWKSAYDRNWGWDAEVKFVRLDRVIRPRHRTGDDVIDPELLEKSFDFDDMALEDDHWGDEYVPSTGGLQWIGSLVSPDRDRLLKFGVAASLILHILAFTVVPRLAQMEPKKSGLRPGEEVQRVRLVNFEQPPAKPEPPPEQASAISDRNHTAPVQRLPKRPPMPKLPMGSPVPPEKRMASVKPPMAPEDFVKPKEDQPKPMQQSRPSTDVSKPHRKAAPKELTPPGTKGKKEDFRNRKVDLRPTQQEIRQGFSSSGGTPDFYPDGDVEEVVVDINAREDRFFSYLHGLKKKIEAAWVYPRVAAQSGLGGQLTLEFSIAREGDLLNVTLLDSSGHNILDESALKAIKSAAPYHPFPPSLRAKRLRIRANFIYVTSDFFRRITGAQ
jgi:periplasmic protein TonB